MFLILRALSGLVFLLALMGAVLFTAAGTIAYPEAWIFLAVYGGNSLLITLYLMVKDRALLERRIQAGPMAEGQASQRLIQGFGTIAFLSIFLVSGLDRRFGWSEPPAWLSIVGANLIALGFFLVFLVFRENTYTSSTIEVAEGQRVISTGPYSVVRHPMYAGLSPLVCGAPLALASYWGLAPAVCVLIVVIARLLDEERFLEKHLAGYPEYRAKVRARLLPFVW